MDVIGYLAAALVLVAFYQRRMVPLRIVAIASNLAFIAYGLALGLTPVWALHVILLPLNARRLEQAWRARQPTHWPSDVNTTVSGMTPAQRSEKVDLPEGPSWVKSRPRQPV
jgi:hypothetical protein